MTNGKILSEVINKGIENNYSANQAIEIFNNLQHKKYYNSLMENSSRSSLQNDELDCNVKDIVCRYFSIYKNKGDIK